MNTRLTWRDVAAPDFGDALAGFATSGDLIANAANTFSGAMNDVNKNRMQRASNKALDAALRFREASSWDQALAAEGLGAFGIDPSLATPELIDFVAKQRSVLAGAAIDDQNLATSQWNLARSQELAPFEDARNTNQLTLDNQQIRRNDFLFDQEEADAERQDYLNERADTEFYYDRNRSRRADIRTDRELLEADVLKQNEKEALSIAQDISRNSPTVGDAQRQLSQMQLDPVMENMVSQAITQQPDGRFSVDPQFEGTSSLLPEFQLANNALAARERELNLQLSNNKPLQLYVEGTEQAARYGSPALALIEDLRGTLDPGKTGDERESIIRSSAATINGKLSRFEREFPQVPSAIIGTVMRNNLDRAHMFSGKLNFDESAIRKELRQLATPQQMRLLETERAKVEQRSLENKELRDQIGLLQFNYEWALSNGNESAASQYLTQLNQLTSLLSPQAPQIPDPTIQSSGSASSSATLAPGIDQFSVKRPSPVPPGQRRRESR